MGKRKRSGSWSKGDESGSKKSDDCDSQEELDGDSFIASNKANIINGVRCSARVQEKQEKLRREASPSKQIPSNSEIVCPNTSGVIGSSTNVSCKGKFADNTEICFPTAPETLPGCAIPVGSEPEGKRKKRTWELWSQYDKQLFFEALNEFGKDFDAIQNHLAAKLKSKTKTVEPTQIKKKEQVRHFYYRTWNKIQKYLHFPKDMKKVFQELYGLVNYGELRKKQRALNGKTAAKLSELVEKGSTTIKVKGKTQRVKTPVCQALKKINNLTDVEHIQVPTKVVVELLPKDGDTWKSVQTLSHNPRVKSLVLLQRTLASIIVFLEERWKSSSDRIKEQMMATFGKRGIKRLRLIPSCVRASNIPIYKAYDTASSAKISLNAYSSNVLNKIKKESYTKLVDSEKRKRKKSGSACGPDASDSVAEADCSDFETHEKDAKEEGGATYSYASIATQLIKKAVDDDLEDTDTELPANQLEKMLQSMQNKSVVNSYDSQDEESDNCTMQKNPEDFPPSQPPALSASCCLCNPCDDKIAEPEPEDIFSTIIDDEIIKKGWTADEAGSLTIGEVYLLVGSNEKISFEYEWDYEEEDTEVKARTRIMLDRLISVARNLKKKKQVRHKILVGQATSAAIGSTTCCPSCGFNATNSSIHPNVPHNTIPNLPINPHSELPSTSAIVSASSSAVQPTSSYCSQAQQQQQPSLPGLSSTISNNISTSTSYQTATVLDVADNSISSTTPSIVPLASSSQQQQQQQQSLIMGVGNANPINPLGENESSTMKVKKITPTLVSSSCTGAMLLTNVTGVSNPSMTTPKSAMEISKQLTDVTVPFIPPSITKVKLDQQQSQQTTFRKPTIGITRLNGNTPTSAYTPIRPAPPSPGENNNMDDSNRNVKSAPTPFTILPKGNRRLGRPRCKKNIVPRYLPLLPKSSETQQPNQQQQQQQQQQQPPMWEIVGNKPPVHTLYVNNPAQLIPVNNLPMTTAATPRTLPLVNSSGNEKEESANALGTNVGIDAKINLIPIKASHSTPSLSSSNGNLEATSNKMLPNPDDNSVASSNYQDLLKVSGIEMESEKSESILSLSSFMDISLSESARNVATECLKSEKFLDVTLGSSNCSLSLSNFLNSADSSNGLSNLDSQGCTAAKDDLETKEKKSNDIFRNQSPPSNLLSHDPHQFMMLGTDGGDLSLGSLLNNLDPVNPVTSSENEMSFQSIIDDSNNHLDFSSRFLFKGHFSLDNKK